MTQEKKMNEGSKLSVDQIVEVGGAIDRAIENGGFVTAEYLLAAHQEVPREAAYAGMAMRASREIDDARESGTSEDGISSLTAVRDHYRSLAGDYFESCASCPNR